MRRNLMISIAVIAMITMLAACGSGSKSGQSAKDCPIGTWSANTEDTGLFTPAPGETVTYTDLAGTVTWTFDADDTFLVTLDEASSVATDNGRTFTVQIEGSIDGKYTTNENSLSMVPRKFDIDLSYDNIAATRESEDALITSLDKGFAIVTGFSCTKDSLTISYLDGYDFTLTKA